MHVYTFTHMHIYKYTHKYAYTHTCTSFINNEFTPIPPILIPPAEFFAFSHIHSRIVRILVFCLLSLKILVF